LCGYTDSDWAGSVDDRKSTFGYVFSLGMDAVTWTSKKQHAVAVSLIEAEYRGAMKGACKAVWLRGDAFRYADAANRANTPIM
jgi:hypothetical protein